MALNAMSSSRMLLGSGESALKENPTEYSEKFAEENTNKLSGSSDSIGQSERSGNCNSPSCNNSSSNNSCGGCKSCHCNCRCSSKRRCSTSDIKSLKASDLFATTMPLRKSSLGFGGTGLRTTADKVEKINLANLVFNPNFKNSSGCVNLPVIRAGQNLAQKNAQRSAMSLAKESLKDLGSSGVPTSDLNQLTQKAAIDLITQQLQPDSLTKLNAKLQSLKIGKQMDNDTDLDIGDILHTFTGKSQAPSADNAARYKTELCRSYEEGGECRLVKTTDRVA